MTFDDNFSHQAAEYARHRPHYPDALYEWIAGIAPARHLAWDVGTGNGQAAVALARHFDRVIATDPSSAQLALAMPNQRVEYALAPAEHTEIPSGSVDAVTAASAVHWFDHDRFYAEVRRVVRPGGVIVVWGYHRTAIGPAVDAILDTFARDTIGPYWSPKLAYVNQHYRTLPFPFEEIAAPPFAIDVMWTADALMGYLRSWSATQAYIRERGHDPVAAIADELRAAWGGAGVERAVRWDLYVRAGRVG